MFNELDPKWATSYTKVMGNYPIDNNRIAEEASWFQAPEKEKVVTEFSESWSTPKRYCYKCSDAISPVGAYIHPDVSYNYMGRGGRFICKFCYDLAVSHAGGCKIGAHE